MNFKAVSASLALACVFSPRVGAQSLVYATGTFAVNGPAVITARPVGWNFSKAIDTPFVFTTGAGNKVQFSLPVGVANSAVRPWGPDAGAPTGRGPLRDAAGRAREAGAGGHDVWFSRAFAFAGEGFAARAAAASLQYKISVASQSAQLGDAGDAVKTLAENDNGTITFTLPAKSGSGSAGARFKEILTEQQYGSLFPNRFGFGKTGEASDGHFDFYSYASLIKAIDNLSSIRVKVLMREGTDYAQKLIWTDTATGVTRTMITHEDYNADWNLDVKEDTIGTILYSNFCGEGTLETRKRELAAFFANVAHETGGGWPDAPNGGQYAWGLYWREEVAWQTNPNNTTLGYVDASNKIYPPYPGKSYHGRGPIQVSWNYNYGQVSEFLYGDKNILLQAPEKVLASGDVAWMTAIWFWMYPQGTIPASHDVMTGKWKPNAQDIANGRDKSRFGVTINVVNGAQECGIGPNDNVDDRVGHFKYFSGIFGLSLEPVLDCYAQKPF